MCLFFGSAYQFSAADRHKPRQHHHHTQASEMTPEQRRCVSLLREGAQLDIVERPMLRSLASEDE